MQVLLFVTLADKDTFTFGQPVLTWAKQVFPQLVLWDIDSFSEEKLVSYAVDLLREAEKYVVCFKTEKPDAPLGTGFRLLEEVIRADKPGLVLLQGEQQRLTAICTSRPQLTFASVDTDAALQEKLKSFFTS